MARRAGATIRRRCVPGLRSRRPHRSRRASGNAAAVRQDKRGDFGRLGMGQQQQRARVCSGCRPRMRRPRRRPAPALRRAREGGWLSARTAARFAGRAAGAAYRSGPRNVPRGRYRRQASAISSVCRAGIGSARVTASPIASKPKPASSVAASASSFRSMRRATCATLRVGKVSPISIVSTAPSTR